MAKAAAREVWAIVAGTSFDGRTEIIRKYCATGMDVDLRREPDNPHDPNAIAVWLKCKRMFGLLTIWQQIGYIKATRSLGLAKRIDEKKVVVAGAYVRSFYAPENWDNPRVSLSIHLDYLE